MYDVARQPLGRAEGRGSRERDIGSGGGGGACYVRFGGRLQGKKARRNRA